MAGLMEEKQVVDMTSMYRALKELGHRRIWLREFGKGARVMLTFEDRIIAGYDRSLHTWCFRKEANWVDGYPDGNPPSGQGLTELTEDSEQLLYLTLQDD